MILVFDMDDTLFPEEEFVMSGFRAVDRHLQSAYGIGHFFERAVELFARNGSGRVFNDFLEEHLGYASPDLVAELVETYRTHFPTINLFPDARWALDRYFRRYALALISDGYLETQRNKARALGLQRWVTTLLFTDEFGRENWKPSTFAYQKCMEQFDGIPSQFWYISDNPTKDFAAPLELGWKTVRVRRCGGVYSAINATPPHEPQFEIRSLYELEALVG